jgi:hypothetical protein
MKNHWAARLEDADRKSRNAPTAELKCVYESLAGHYRALEAQCRDRDLRLCADNDGIGGMSEAA